MQAPAPAVVSSNSYGTVSQWTDGSSQSAAASALSYPNLAPQADAQARASPSHPPARTTNLVLRRLRDALWPLLQHEQILCAYA
jgi:hypothetical protein